MQNDADRKSLELPALVACELARVTGGAGDPRGDAYGGVWSFILGGGPSGPAGVGPNAGGGGSGGGNLPYVL
jgi:hypothetical protein